MSKQGKHMATSCLVLAGSKLVRSCPSRLWTAMTCHTPPCYLSDSSLQSCILISWAAVVHHGFLFLCGWWVWWKVHSVLLLNRLLLTIARLLSLGGFFPLWISSHFYKNKTVWFLLNGAVSSRRKKKKKWEFRNNFKIFKGMERDCSESLLLLS